MSKQLQSQHPLTPLQATAMQELSLARVMAAEILARAAFYAHSILPPGLIKPYRSQAHATLAQVLDEVELTMTDCKGRA